MTRRGMTLVEMLVALAATLLLMTAIAQAFSVFGSAISDSRAVLDLDGRLRNAAWRLRADLAGATARMLPPLTPASGEGYFEIIEGPATDRTDTSGAATAGQVVSGDHDDVLLLTTRSVGAPFIGRGPSGGPSLVGQTSTFESTLAEVGWFTRPNPNTSNPVTYTLYRKQLLVMGYVGYQPFLADNNSLSWNTYGNSWSGYFNAPCDISARLEGNTLFPNSIADLTRREARFMHNLTGNTNGSWFPYRFASEDRNNNGILDAGEDTNSNLQLESDHQSPVPLSGLIFGTSSPRQGEDVVLTNVIAFDVRVFDPGAAVYVTSGTALAPGDPLYNPGSSSNTGTASGAYVDLGHNQPDNFKLTSVVVSGSAAKFAGYGQPRSSLQGSSTTRRTYDTWSLHYEADGLNQYDGPGIAAGTVDEGTNGVDDDGDGNFDEPAYDADGDGVFDDLGETETLPPYPVPLRGIEVRIRCYEPSSRQVRQVTIRHTFVTH